jgi:hypothetical protein
MDFSIHPIAHLVDTAEIGYGTFSKLVGQFIFQSY